MVMDKNVIRDIGEYQGKTKNLKNGDFIILLIYTEHVIRADV